MDTSTYPGKGLSRSQLVFALNEELRRTAFSPLYVERGQLGLVEEQDADHLRSVAPDVASQLERDLSTTAREWKNSFVPINRIPTDILSLIPTHLPSHKDRFRASFVCRHWRRTFIQHGALWSQLFLTKGEEYVTTLLERSKGSALEIITDCEAPLGTTTLLSPHAGRIRHLEFVLNYLADVLAFSEASPGPLPFLRTLRIRLDEPRDPHDQPDILTTPLFSGAVNLEEFVLDFRQAELLKYFVFPNLTVLKLSATLMDGLNVSDLFDFLKVAPTLRTVEVKVGRGIILGDIPEDMAIVLPNVETFYLFVVGSGYQVYEPVARISCPRAKSTSLMLGIFDIDITTSLEIFPDPISWKEIARQYGSSPVEEVTLEMDYNEYSLAFQASDATVITLGFGVTDTSMEVEDLNLSQDEMHLEIFSQAFRTIRGHPLLSCVKRLHIEDSVGLLGRKNLIPAANTVADLFKGLGPLDELTIRSPDAEIFLAPFVDLPEFRHFERMFPPVKELTISAAWIVPGRYMDGIVELAKSQHELGIPFERVTVRMAEVSVGFVERLREWVSAVDV